MKPLRQVRNAPTLLALLKQGCELTTPAGLVLVGLPISGAIVITRAVPPAESPERPTLGLYDLRASGLERALRDMAGAFPLRKFAPRKVPA